MAESLQIRADDGDRRWRNPWDSAGLAERPRLDLAEPLDHLT